MIECHKEGWATRGKFSVEVAYVRQYGRCEALTVRISRKVIDWGDDLYKAVKSWQVNAGDIVALIRMCSELQAKFVLHHRFTSAF